MNEATEATDDEKKKEDDKKKTYIPMSLKATELSNIVMKAKSSAKLATSGSSAMSKVRQGKAGWGVVGGKMRKGGNLSIFIEGDELRPPTIEESIKALNDKLSGGTQSALMGRVEKLEAAVKANASSVAVTNAKLDSHSELLERLLALVSSERAAVSFSYAQSPKRSAAAKASGLKRASTEGRVLQTASGGPGSPQRTTPSKSPQPQTWPGQEERDYLRKLDGDLQGGASVKVLPSSQDHAVLTAIERHELREESEGQDPHTRSSPPKHGSCNNASRYQA